jgi:hypothetical protein
VGRSGRHVADADERDGIHGPAPDQHSRLTRITATQRPQEWSAVSETMQRSIHPALTSSAGAEPPSRSQTRNSTLPAGPVMVSDEASGRQTGRHCVRHRIIKHSPMLPGIGTTPPLPTCPLPTSGEA